MDPAGRVFQAEGAPVTVGKRNAVHFRAEGTESPFVRPDLAGQAQRHQRPSMKGVIKGYDSGPFGRVSRHLYGVLDGFGSAVDKKGLFWKIAGRQLVEPFGQF